MQSLPTPSIMGASIQVQKQLRMNMSMCETRAHVSAHCASDIVMMRHQFLFRVVPSSRDIKTLATSTVATKTKKKRERTNSNGVFDEPNYYGCIPTQHRSGHSILRCASDGQSLCYEQKCVDGTHQPSRKTGEKIKSGQC